MGEERSVLPVHLVIGSDTTLQDEIEGQRTRLKTAGIDLQVQGQTELSAELKDKALLVRDFFGRGWATDFCPRPTTSRSRV